MFFRKSGMTLAVLAMTLSMLSPLQAAEKNCDRRCLLEHLTTYTEALADDDTSRIKAAENIRVTSNGEVVKLGKSEVWGLANRLPYRQAFVDPVTGSAMFLGTVTNSPAREEERWWFYMVRLKVEEQKVTEVEEIAYAGRLRGVPASTLVLPDRIFDTLLPEDERSSREELIATAHKYFDVVSGYIDYHDVPWHPECQRKENAVMTVNSRMLPASCGGEFQDPRITWIVKDRRIYIADEKRGLVMAAAHFTSPPDYPDNNESVAFEVFKVQDGLIRHIEAMFRGNSSQTKSGWEDHYSGPDQ